MSFQDMLLAGLANMNANEDVRSVLNQFVQTQDRGSGDWSPCVDVVDTPNNLYIYVDIPGVIDSSINVDFFNNKLSVTGEKLKKYSASTLKNEIIYGKFARNITLPMSVTNKQNVSVKYENGVLLITIDKQQEEQNRFRINLSSETNNVD